MEVAVRGSGIAGVADVDMPREKLERLGPEGLRDEELLAILLRTGYEGKNVLEVAGAILRKHPPEALLEMGLEALVGIKGIGRAKAAGLVAGFELSRRVQKYPGHHRGFAQYEGRCPITVAGSRLNPFIPVAAS